MAAAAAAVAVAAPWDQQAVSGLVAELRASIQQEMAVAIKDAMETLLETCSRVCTQRMSGLQRELSRLYEGTAAEGNFPLPAMLVDGVKGESKLLAELAFPVAEKECTPLDWAPSTPDTHTPASPPCEAAVQFETWESPEDPCQTSASDILLLPPTSARSSGSTTPAEEEEAPELQSPPAECAVGGPQEVAEEPLWTLDLLEGAPWQEAHEEEACQEQDLAAVAAPVLDDQVVKEAAPVTAEEEPATLGSLVEESSPAWQDWGEADVPKCQEPPMDSVAEPAAVSATEPAADTVEGAQVSPAVDPSPETVFRMGVRLCEAVAECCPLEWLQHSSPSSPQEERLLSPRSGRLVLCAPSAQPPRPASRWQGSLPGLQLVTRFPLFPVPSFAANLSLWGLAADRRKQLSWLLASQKSREALPAAGEVGSGLGAEAAAAAEHVEAEERGDVGPAAGGEEAAPGAAEEVEAVEPEELVVVAAAEEELHAGEEQAGEADQVLEQSEAAEPDAAVVEDDREEQAVSESEECENVVALEQTEVCSVEEDSLEIDLPGMFGDQSNFVPLCERVEAKCAEEVASKADSESPALLSPRKQADVLKVKPALAVQARSYHIVSKVDAAETDANIQLALRLMDKTMRGRQLPANSTQKYWLVVGGATTGGVLVRKGRELDAPVSSGRLNPGTLVKELDLQGARLFFQNCTSHGPKTGWVSISSGGKALVVRFRTSQAAQQEWSAKGQLVTGICDLVPMGQYCHTANALRSHGLRRQALPLDWSAHDFRLWKHMLEDDFKTLLTPNPHDGSAHPYNDMNLPANAMFIHQGNWANSDVKRRVPRLKNILANKRAFGIAIYMEGLENTVQTLPEIIRDAQSLLEVEPGFHHIVLVWVKKELSEPPQSEWLDFDVSERLSVLSVKPTEEANYDNGQLPLVDSGAIVDALRERFPVEMTCKTPVAEDKELDVLEHWNDVFDDSAYRKAINSRRMQEEAHRRAAEQRQGAVPRLPVRGGRTPTWPPEVPESTKAKCYDCKRTTMLVHDPIKEGLCKVWDKNLYCRNCWGSYLASDFSGRGFVSRRR